MMPGRTLALVASGIERLKPFEGSSEDAVILFGESKRGKSTLTNVYWCDTEYEDVEGELQLKPGEEECTVTSDGISSKTIYPEIFKSKGFAGADMPGFRESRGFAYETAAGITVQYFNKIFSKVKLMVLVITPGDLFAGGGKDLVEVLNNFGAIIGKSTERMDNVLFLINTRSDGINRSMQKVLERLKKISTSRDLTENSQFLLQSIQERNIFITSPVDPSFKSKFTEIIRQANSTPIADFNLASFHRNVDGFKQLMRRVEDYVNDRDFDKNSVLASIAAEQLRNLRDIKKSLEDYEFLAEINQPGLVVSTQIAEQDELNKKLQAQHQCKKQMLDELMDPVIGILRADYQNQTIDKVGTLKKAERFALQTQIANRFLRQINAVGLTHLDDRTRVDVKYPSSESQVSQEGSSHYYASGSFGFPGAEAIDIDMSQYEQDENGIWEYIVPQLEQTTYFDGPRIDYNHSSSEPFEQSSQSGFFGNLAIPDVPLNDQIALIAVVCHTVGKWLGWVQPERRHFDTKTSLASSESNWSAGLWRRPEVVPNISQGDKVQPSPSLSIG
ncbi:MAG: hypothetical protein P1U74_03775 [Legionellaceae bacterium]|nr:hypothetical protein [Legionellaceae bacterium]